MHLRTATTESGGHLQHDLAVGGDRRAHLAALLQISEEDPLRERLLHHLLEEPRHRPGAELRREAVVREPLARVVLDDQLDILLAQLTAKLLHLLVDDPQDDGARKPAERDPGVEAVAELGAEGALDGRLRGAALGAVDAELGVARLAAAHELGTAGAAETHPARAHLASA